MKVLNAQTKADLPLPVISLKEAKRIDTMVYYSFFTVNSILLFLIYFTFWLFASPSPQIYSTSEEEEF